MRERVSLDSMGVSSGRRQPFNKRFQTVLRPWDGPALYVTAQCMGKRWYGRIEKGMGASFGAEGGI